MARSAGAIGRSGGGLSTKIHTLVDALGNPLGFFLTGGEAHDLVGADHLLPTMAADALIADKAFDADARVLEPLAAAGKTAVIPPRANRSSLRNYDRPLYGERHLIENFFAKIKQFRAIATRYEKTARNFLAAVQLVASVVWVKLTTGPSLLHAAEGSGWGRGDRDLSPEHRQKADQGGMGVSPSAQGTFVWNFPGDIALHNARLLHRVVIHIPPHRQLWFAVHREGDLVIAVLV